VGEWSANASKVVGRLGNRSVEEVNSKHSLNFEVAELEID
jgi:hypothetical protein